MLLHPSAADRGSTHRPYIYAVITKDPTNGARLHRITHRRTRAMTLHKRRITDILNSSYAVRPAHQRHMSLLVRIRNANRLAVKVSRRRLDDTPDRVAIPQRVI